MSPDLHSGRRRRPLLTMITATAAAALVAVIVAVIVGGSVVSTASPVSTDAAVAVAPPPSSAPSPGVEVAPVPSIDAAAVATLPEARYDAVIGGLLRFSTDRDPTAAVYAAAADLPLFGSATEPGADGGGGEPVGRLAAHDFLGETSPIVVVRTVGPWALVLTPARRTRPSATPQGEQAAAQTAAWAPLSMLTPVSTPSSRVEISVAQRTVSIVDLDGTVRASFPAAVGAEGTPTPTGVVGYLEARYVDASQGTGDHPITLTSLHSVAADEPFGGSDGGLIGIHYSDDREGAVSHGCVRVGADAVAALSALPVGTLVALR